MVRRPDDGRWAGLWDFPRFQVHSQQPAALSREMVRGVRRETGMRIELGRHLKTIKHGVTRFRITLDCYEAKHVSGPDGEADLPQAPPEMRWLRPAELAEYPLSTTGRTLSRLMG
jgi:A/G-specific adenine glycosylase